MKNIWIVISVHNRKEFTRVCLESLKRQTYQKFSIVIFDDGSTDGTAIMVAKQYPEVVLLKGDGNYWWSRSMNEGIRYALNNGAKYIIFLNNDVKLTENYIRVFVEGLIKYPNALQGSLAYDKKTKKLVYDQLIRNWRKVKSERISELYAKDNFPDFIKVTHLPGRGTLIPAKVFNDIGLLDAKNFPQTAADNDFSLRAAEAGYALKVNTRAILYSLGEVTGAATFRNPYLWRNFFGYLTSIKSNANMIVVFKYCYRHCPKKYLLYNLVKIYLLSIGGYIKHWLQNKRSNSL